MFDNIRPFSTMRVYFFFILIILDVGNAFRCNRRPYGSNSEASESDGRFKLSVAGLDNNAYIPEQLYTVELASTDGESTFSSFMITMEGDTKADLKNPRRIVTTYPGDLRPISTSTAKFSDRCPYSVEQAITAPKSSIEVYWQAPSSGNGCITLRAMVSENDAVWFEDGGPLTIKLCEDLRQPDDVAPLINTECGICDEAKYELSFNGIWSRNTHPYLYPENDWVPKYSDLVGASHADDYILWTPGALATEGFKEMAEHANTSTLEAEMRTQIGDGVRTIIKGKGHGYRKMSVPTYSFFRVDRINHLFSAVVGLSPSPDWFLGVTRFELCQEDNTWLPERELNLYPWDAGTDSGISYESPNAATFPQDSITRVQMSTYDKNSPFYEMDIKDMHPFGKFHIKLIRTYQRDCPEPTEGSSSTNEPEELPDKTESGDGSNESKSGEDPNKSEPEAPSRYQTEIDSGNTGGEPPEETVTVPVINCPMTSWPDWSPCDGDCIDGKVIGYKWRERYHLVNGVAVEKYDPNVRHSHTKKHSVPAYCKTHFDTFEKTECEEDCNEEMVEEDDVTAQRRVAQIKPGGRWNRRSAFKTRS